MLVDLSGKLVHRGFLSAHIPSGSSRSPLSISPADFTCDYEEEPHGPEKQSQDGRAPQSLPFPTNPFPFLCHHHMSFPTFPSKMDLGTTPHLSVGEVQVLGVGSIRHRVGQAMQLVGFLIAQLQGQKL